MNSEKDEIDSEVRVRQADATITREAQNASLCTNSNVGFPYESSGFLQCEMIDLKMM